MHNTTLAQRPAPVQSPRTNYIYSKTAACQILKRNDVKEVEIWANVVKISFLSGSPRITSKKPFLKYFAESRRLRGVELECKTIERDHLYEVRSGRIDNKSYLLEISLEDWVKPRVYCPCHDYATQVEIGVQTPCCKHVYSVLNKLGFDSYHTWIEFQEF